MQKVCAISGEAFRLTNDDIRFYQKIDVPLPTCAPLERSRRRLSFRNERHLCWRSCMATGKKIISQYSAESGVPVVAEKYWWSDAWDARTFGRPIDFHIPFFSQWAALEKEVPHLPNHSGDNENAEYTSYAGWNKNCYMIFFADHNRDCFHSNHCFYDVDCADCSYVVRSELCLGCTVCEDCYECMYAHCSTNCAHSLFLQNCIGCSYCIGCVNQRNAKYMIFNQSCSKEEYQRLRLELQSRRRLNAFMEHFKSFAAQQPRRAIFGTRYEQVTGEYISSSKNLRCCFHVEHCRDSSYLADCQRTTDSYDVDGWGGTGATLLYECSTVGEGAHMIRFSNHCFSGVRDLDYCYSCMSSHDLFGCVGMRHASYCILNKQYTKNEYFELRQKLISHMQQCGEWGEYFPAALSHFAYNDTVAHEYYPLSKEEVVSRGLRWRQSEEVHQAGDARRSPADSDVDDAATAELFECATCGKNYQFQKNELRIYRMLLTPLPECCPNCRHSKRSTRLNRRTLRSVACHRCDTIVETASESGAVMCERCFRNAIGQ